MAEDTRRAAPLNPRGRHPHNALSPKRIQHLKKPGRYADGSGLYLFVDDSLAKRWIWRGIVRGQRVELGLGSVTLVSLADARDEAIRLKRIARAGGDPRAERAHAKRIVPTFKEAATEWHADNGASFRNAKARAQWLSSLETHIFPAFGTRQVDAITSSDVQTALTRIWQTTPETARRLKQRIKVVFDWPKVKEHRTGAHPTEDVTIPKHRGERAHHAALPYQAVPAFLVSLRSAPAGELAKLAFELLILTATRTSEVVGATWTEVDLDKRIWIIPGVRMKKGREHRVPLSPRAVEIVTQAKALSDGGPFVFPGRRSAKPMSPIVFFTVLRQMQQDAITTHGFRSSFRDWAAERTNVPSAVCEAALAHAVQDRTEAAYFRSDLFEKRRELMDTWARFATATPADVVAIRA